MITYIIFHVFCSIVVYGSAFAMMQRKFPLCAESEYWLDFVFAAGMAVTGPIGVLLLTSNGGWGYGFKWR